MKFTDSELRGAYIIEPEFRRDERGFFARTYCVDEFVTQDIRFSPIQINNSSSARKGTVRGLHYQIGSHAEAKLFRCIAGRAYVVIVDLRPESATYKKWHGVELTPGNRLQLYMPKGCAAGYMALEDNTEVIYAVDERYAPEAERGLRWDDPAFGIQWPITENVIVSPKDAAAPDYTG